MKTKVLHYIVAFCFLGLLPVKTVALNYTITFTGTGASSMVDSVMVQSLTKGTSVTVPAGNVLNLSDVATAITPLGANDEKIRVYPTSANGKFIVSFFSKQAGSTQINAFSIDGKKIAGISADLQSCNNTFELALPKGVFVIQVTGNEYTYTAKLLNSSGTQGNPGIVYKGIEKLLLSGLQKTKSSTLGITTMTYTAGDQLLYKGISGNYSTIVTDVPTGDKTTNFNFVACTDADGNNYTVVTIGTQTWMAENMKSTKYNDGTFIPLVTDSTAWGNLTTPGYCWFNDDAATYKNQYGALYNWYTVNTGKLAPTGWHVSSDAEWTTLGNYLTAAGYNCDGSISGDSFAKSLAATSNWITDTGGCTIGNDLSKNNKTGFSALPVGDRDSYGFHFAGYYGGWWGSTEYDTNFAWCSNLYFNSSYLYSASIKGIGFSVRCVRDSILLPTIITSAASSISTTTATSGGNITDDGGATITARGVCWSTSANPTIADSITTDSTGAGIFTSVLTGLTANTTYNIRAYATNGAGTAYGTKVSFTTPASSENTITDLDGNVYHTVTIGTQTWMVENLKTTKYNDGTAIPLVADSATWTSLTTPGYCWYNNDVTTYKNTYGALYNWYTVNTGKLAPSGWHVATDNEWTTLSNYLGGWLVAGGKLKQTSTSLWSNPNYGATNESGFSALPGGYRVSSGIFNDLGNYGSWWCSTDGINDGALDRLITYYNSYVYNGDDNKAIGYSVRCVRDTISLPTLTTTAVSSVTTTTATSGGNITDDGGATITARGVCWSTSANPTISDSITTDEKGTGTFTSALTVLTANTTYNIRAYATNSAGTAYGNQLSFTTTASSENTITDIGGNVYHTVTIGTQTWMVENLKTTKYNDGTAIPNVTDNTVFWGNLTTPAYCWYNNDADTYKNMYGALYNWYTVNTGKLAPTGWHVPTDAEWTTMENYLIANGYNYDLSTQNDYLAKSLAATTNNWDINTNVEGAIGNDLSKNNTTGFSALPGGYRYDSGFGLEGNLGAWWSSTGYNAGSLWFRYLGYNDSSLNRGGGNESNGFSVRCVRDN